MSEKIVSVLLYGLLFTLVFDFLFFAGLYVHYIRANGIPVFFNLFFVDNQIWWLWLPSVVVLGVLFVSEIPKTVKGAVFLLFFSLSALAWVPPVGKGVGTFLFDRGVQRYRFGEKVVSGRLLYSGRGVDYVRIGTKVVRYPAARRF